MVISLEVLFNFFSLGTSYTNFDNPDLKIFQDNFWSYNYDSYYTVSFKL